MPRTGPDRKRITLSDAAAARLREIGDEHTTASRLVQSTQPGTEVLLSTGAAMHRGTVTDFTTDGPRMVWTVRSGEGIMQTIVLEVQ